MEPPARHQPRPVSVFDELVEAVERANTEILEGLPLSIAGREGVEPPEETALIQNGRTVFTRVRMRSWERFSFGAFEAKTRRSQAEHRALLDIVAQAAAREGGHPVYTPYADAMVNDAIIEVLPLGPRIEGALANAISRLHANKFLHPGHEAATLVLVVDRDPGEALAHRVAAAGVDLVVCESGRLTSSVDVRKRHPWLFRG